MKTLIIGGHGQLGSDVVKALDGNKTFVPNRQQLDLLDPYSLEKTLDEWQPELVINCAAFHDVAKCEEDPSLAMEMNAFAVDRLARLTAKNTIKLLHISTDYVFDGSQVEGYTEEDSVHPLMWYGKSKYAGECAALTQNPQTFVVRVQSLYGKHKPRGKGLNFVEMMRKLAKERDEIQVDQCLMAPTWTWPLAQNLVALSATDHFGLYHMSTQGATTWYDFAKKILEKVHYSGTLTPVANDFFPKNFTRPENTYLLQRKLEKIGCDLMPSWETSLEEYLKD